MDTQRRWSYLDAVLPSEIATSDHWQAAMAWYNCNFWYRRSLLWLEADLSKIGIHVSLIQPAQADSVIWTIAYGLGKLASIIGVPLLPALRRAIAY